MLAKIATVVALICLGFLFLQTSGVMTMEADTFKVVCIVGAVAAFVWAAVVLF